MIGIIGGTGTDSLLDTYDVVERKTIDTKYGTSPEISIIEMGSKQVAYMPRHSKGHSMPPHKINYRANIEALDMIGVNKVFATNAVGSLDTNIIPGDILIADNFIDFTHGRNNTFFDEEVVHIDCTMPFCKDLRSNLISCGDVHPYGVYIVIDGPRFETKAEIDFYRLIGGKVVGMTLCPEIVLAREKQMCYASICAVTDDTAATTEDKLTMTEITETMKLCSENLLQLLTKTIEKTDEKFKCECQSILDDAII
ncbi:MAG: MTAP family purine nucleoside phosphorylase [Methanosphaera sp.]|uniref:MTAP family purine nucleoside phosphorylase n=1 Tax=Methanosphaera sp. TaxID=2666342 RepID=UPI0025DF2DF8|nr:MTAP family purine nucleoside phosphorylase [Methanosphaera sp.]MCI5866555.1 MTAP family purine nucleoside phosphorylase [Methanosphaera sp.]MDD6535031.1 MTAP family purine nucleoside phosphorylase [Methanosphaera sp.]MDY3955464.1 MTAP family purine nucleoside phosphorylase [Methanosphaera sp.]